MKTQGAISSQAGRAELGLLAALLVFAGGIGALVWAVIQNHTPQTASSEATTRGFSAGSSQGDPKPADNAPRRPSVTIVADPQAQTALEKLRQISPGEGKQSKPKKADVLPANEHAAPPAPQLAVDGQVVNWDSPEVIAAVQLLKKYGAAKSWKDKLPLVHESGQVRPLMEEYYGSQGAVDPTLNGGISASNIKIGKRDVLALSYSSSERLNMMVHANFWRNPEGLRLDWESFVGFSGKPMAAFRAGHCAEPTVFRVLAVLDDYFNFEFADAARYLSLRLYSPNGQDYVHGFCTRDSPDGRKLLELLDGTPGSRLAAGAANGLRSQAGSHFPITVRLAFPENAQSDRCVKIEKFVSPWWLALDAETQSTAALESFTPTDAVTR